MPNEIAHSFPPIAARDARVLILGSMPGQASLDAQQYYAYPHNAFWRIMAELIGFEVSLPYTERCDALIGVRVAVWDVMQSCVRPGSLDSAIVESTIVPNDFTAFFDQHPEIQQVCFNGAKAESSFRKHVMSELGLAGSRLAYARLPSTSPAHASLSFDAKRDAWHECLQPLVI
ncbi:MAG: DNA-deoxyinosine glycosylase [Pseudomonadota bacterium]